MDVQANLYFCRYEEVVQRFVSPACNDGYFSMYLIILYGFMIYPHLGNFCNSKFAINIKESDRFNYWQNVF